MYFIFTKIISASLVTTGFPHLEPGVFDALVDLLPKTKNIGAVKSLTKIIIRVLAGDAGLTRQEIADLSQSPDKLTWLTHHFSGLLSNDKDSKLANMKAIRIKSLVSYLRTPDKSSSEFLSKYQSKFFPKIEAPSDPQETSLSPYREISRSPSWDGRESSPSPKTTYPGWEYFLPMPPIVTGNPSHLITSHYEPTQEDAPTTLSWLNRTPTPPIEIGLANPSQIITRYSEPSREGAPATLSWLDRTPTPPIELAIPHQDTASQSPSQSLLSKPTPTAQREIHNAQEQKRRNNTKELLAALNKELPETTPPRTTNATVTDATAFILELQAEEAALVQALQALKDQKTQLIRGLTHPPL